MSLRRVLQGSRLAASGQIGAVLSAEGIHSSALAQNAPDLITVTVDGRPVQVPKNATVLQACETAGIDVPR